MEHWLWIILAALFFECKGEDRVIQPPGDVIQTEGDSVTLDCTFESSSTNPYLFWYKQEVNECPIYILRRDSYGTDNNAQEFNKDRFDATIKDKSVPLKIQKLQLSDSAVYYCALKTGGYEKILFGSGTKLTVESKEEHEPSFYKLGDNETKVCLATGFSRFKKLESNTLFNETQPVRISEDSVFNQVAYMNGTDNSSCEEEDSEAQCAETVETDPMVNLMFLTTFGLRILFIKTIIFNVLMTLRLWISQ